MTGPDGASRLHYMDAMRSVLMSLGIVLHAARPYDSEPWRVKDDATLPVLDHVVSAIHVFRMPAFFLVAGFFAMFLLRRRPSTAVFLRERVRRILLPFVATLLTFNVVQLWIEHGDGGVAGFLAGVLVPAWRDGSWVSHLWFLPVLAVYLFGTGLAAPWLRALDRNTRTGWLDGPWGPALVVAVGAAAPVASAVLATLLHPAVDVLLLGMFSVATLLQYLPFFAAGLLLCLRPALLDRFSRVSIGVVLVALLGAAGVAASSGRDGDLYGAALLVSSALLAWMSARLVFAVFRRWANGPSRLFAYLSDASYSIYLFHHVAVVATALVLVPLDWPPIAKWLTVMAVATAFPLCIFQFILLRSPLLRLVFNGKPPAAHGRLPAVEGDGVDLAEARRS